MIYYIYNFNLKCIKIIILLLKSRPYEHEIDVRCEDYTTPI